jgi:gamma-glutamyl:cysteine ligase YbdK (ATP-grasp superfamily)
MVKMAIEQLKPEFEKMAVKAAEQAFENKMTKVRELNEELNKKERELKQLRLEKKILQAKLEIVSVYNKIDNHYHLNCQK